MFESSRTDRGHESIPTRGLAHGPLRLTELSLGCAQLGNLSEAIATTQAQRDRRRGLGARDPLLRYGAALRPWALGTTSRRRTRRPSARRVRRLDEGRPADSSRSSRRFPADSTASQFPAPTDASGTSAATGSADRSRRASSGSGWTASTSSTCMTRTTTGTRRTAVPTRRSPSSVTKGSSRRSAPA